MQVAGFKFPDVQNFIAATFALALGAAIAVLPVAWSLVILTMLAAAALALYEPLLAVGLALTFGPFKSLIAVELPEYAAFDPGQIFFGFALAGWALRGLARRRLALPALPIAAPVGLFIAAAAVSLVGAVDQTNGLKELLKWIEVVATAMIVLDAARRRHIGWVLAALLVAGAAQAAVGIWQFGLRGSGPDHFEIRAGFYRAYGAFEQPNPFGGFMGMVWPLAAGLAAQFIIHNAQFTIKNKRFEFQNTITNYELRITNYAPILIALIIAAALTGLALILSFSRGAWLGAAAAAVVMLALWPRRRLVGLAVGVAAVLLSLGLLSLGVLPPSIAGRLEAVSEFVQVYDVRGADIRESNFSLIERIALWQAAVGMADANPWRGVGIGNWDAAYEEFRLLNWRVPLGHAHNIYLNMLAETGLLGLAAYLVMWAGIVRLTLRAANRRAGWRRALAIGLLGVWAHLAVHQLVDNLYVNNLHLYLGALLGVLSWLVVSPGAQRSDKIGDWRLEMITISNLQSPVS